MRSVKVRNDLKKEWSDLEVELKIREAFQDVIPRLADFEILQSVHTKLLRPTLAQGQYLTGAMIHRIFRDKPIYVRPTQQILKLPKQRKTRDDLDDQVDFDNEFEVTNGNLTNGNLTNGNLGLLSSTRATGEKAADTVNFPSVPNSCSDNNAIDAMGSGLPSTSGSAPTSYDEMNAITDSSEQYQHHFQMHMTTILVPFMKVVLMKMLTYLQPFMQVLQIRKGEACPLVRRRLMLS